MADLLFLSVIAAVVLVTGLLIVAFGGLSRTGGGTR